MHTQALSVQVQSGKFSTAYSSVLVEFSSINFRIPKKEITPMAMPVKIKALNVMTE